MSAPSRTAQFSKLHKVLKKHYKPTTPDEKRTVLEHLLFACCLEGAHYDAAEESYAALVHNFFDWNEVRVSTVRELSEVMARLPEPAAAATRLKRVLQGVFEANYNFDLEELRKMNLGPATEKLTKLKGSTPFSVGYVVQAALEGHSIPLDAGTLAVMLLLDTVSEGDARNSVVPGLERAIPKNKGFEFGSLLHQLGADFANNPYSPKLHEILVEVHPGVRDRLPKRRKAVEAPVSETDKGAAKTGEKEGAAAVEEKPKRGAGGRKKAAAAGATSKEKASGAKSPESKPAVPPVEPKVEKAPERKKVASVEEKEPASGKKKPLAAKKDAKESPPAKEPLVKKKGAAEKEKPPVEPSRKEKEAGAKESGPSGLAKRKPR